MSRANGKWVRRDFATQDEIAGFRHMPPKVVRNPWNDEVAGNVDGKDMQYKAGEKLTKKFWDMTQTRFPVKTSGDQG